MHFFPRKHLLIGSSIFSQKNTNQEAKKTVKQTKLNTTAVKKMRYNKKGHSFLHLLQNRFMISKLGLESARPFSLLHAKAQLKIQQKLTVIVLNTNKSQWYTVISFDALIAPLK